MAVPVTLPAMGESVTEGTIIRWLKKEGEWVDADEPLVEISTDKIDTELPSPSAGRLTEIKVKEDATVEVGAELAVIDETASKDGGGDGQVKAPPKETEKKEEPAPEKKAAKEAPKEKEPSKEKEPERAPEAAAEEQADEQVPVRQREQVAAETATQDRESARGEVLSPLVRKLAREQGVDLSKIAGTGPGGRVTKQDVLDAAGGTEPAQAPAPAQAPEPARAEAPSSRPPAPAPAAAQMYAVPAAASEDVPFSHVRKAIADHMVRSRHTAAHVTNIVEIDMTRVARLRDRAKNKFKSQEGFSLTFLPFIAHAVVQALRAFPEFNAHVLEDGKTARLFRQVNLGIAVGRDEGLIVPVVHGADGMNLVGVARAINDVATRAKTKGALRPDDVSGGTFTITNYGSVGGVMDTPIINHPQVAILGTGAIVKRPAVISVDGADAIAIRNIAFHSLSYDHRWIDGHRATMFNVRIKQILEAADFASELGLEPES